MDHVIKKPTLLIKQHQVIENIKKMKKKADNNNILLRPHFKTHQSVTVGEWMKHEGIKHITVSSVTMAQCFANYGWDDITIAFPINVREIEEINILAKKVRLNLLMEDETIFEILETELHTDVNVWIKIDVGANRTGILWDNIEGILTLAKKIINSKRLKLRGILSHAGQSYYVKGKDKLEKIHIETLQRMKKIKAEIKETLNVDLAISIGDTPTLSTTEIIEGVNEIRPGNFVYYDISQLTIGSCKEEDIALAVACPIVAKHTERGEIVIYGGAIHLSKDYIEIEEGVKSYGRVCYYQQDQGWSKSIVKSFVKSLSQEHGIVKVSQEVMENVSIGDLLVILPIHACLVVSLANISYTTNLEKVIHCKEV